MANVIQLKRGNEAQRTGFTPAAGEPIFILDENKMYIGDGSTAVQSLSALGGDLTMANGSNNRVMTATSSSGMNAEANLTFDGSTLAVTGDATVSDDLGLLSDDAELTFGANSEVKLIHVHNEGLLLKHTATADDKPVSLVLQTGETDIAADDVIGKIGFQAPDEGTGTDAILMAAEIAAISEGDFAADANATSLHFRTGSSAAAADRIIITSAGHLVPAADNTSDLGTSSLEFKDGYFDGILYVDAINFNGTAISATAAEINLIDGGTSRGTTAVANGDGFLHNDGGTMRMTNVSKMADLFAGTGISASNSVLSVDAAQTGITSLLATDIKIGEDDQTKIDFETADKIHFYAANAKQVVIEDGAILPGTDNDIDLGASGTEFKDAFFDGTVTTDALVVQGNATVQNILAGTTANSIQFEGATDDTNETTLAVIDPTSDRTINLPNQDGTLGVFAAASTTQISSTPEELNILDGVTATTAEINLIDGGTSRGTTAVANGDGFLHNDGGTMRMTNVSKMADLFAGTGIDASSSVLSTAAAQTGITSILATDLKIGEDDQTKIDFETANAIHFYGNNVNLIALTNANSGDAVLTVPTADKNFTIKGTDDSSAITALDIDMAAAGKATFNGEIVAASLDISGNVDVDGTLETDALSIASTTVTSTAAELNVLDGITAVVGELNALDLGSTAVGTAIASKAVILDSNKDYDGIRNFTITGALDGATISGGTF